MFSLEQSKRTMPEKTGIERLYKSIEPFKEQRLFEKDFNKKEANIDPDQIPGRVHVD